MMKIFQTCQVALNFANEEEAKKFRKAVTDLLGRRQRKSGNPFFNYLNWTSKLMLMGQVWATSCFCK